MLGWQIYLATRKKNDQLWNHYVMRPLAGFVVAAVAPTRVTPNQLTLLNLFLFVIAAGLLIALPAHRGGLAAIAVLELSCLLDCADGMLARHKKQPRRQGTCSTSSRTSSRPCCSRAERECNGSRNVKLFLRPPRG